MILQQLLGYQCSSASPSITNPTHTPPDLPVASRLDHGHDDVLRGHEGQLLGDVALDHLGVHHQTLANVLQSGEHAVGCQEGLGQADAPGKSMRCIGA